MTLPLGVALIGLAAVAAISSFSIRGLGSLGPISVFLVSIFITAASVPMGLVVPLLVARSTKDDPRLPGFLYAGNTLGSALAVLATGFLLLPALGNMKTLWCASALLAGLGAFLCRGRPGPAADYPPPVAPPPGPAGRLLSPSG